MSKVDRLDFSKPPNGYLVWFDDGWSCVCWGLEDDGQAINTPDDNLTEDAAIAASWDHYKARHDPPGIETKLLGQITWGWGTEESGTWTGLTQDGGAARAAAWAHYVDAVEVAGLLDTAPARFFDHRGRDVPRYWPAALTWAADQRTEVRRWLVWHTSTGQKVARPPALPEVLRVR